MANAMRSLKSTDSLLSKAFGAFDTQTEQTKRNVDNIVNLHKGQNLNSNAQLHRNTQNTIQATWQATAKVLNFSAR